MEAFLFHYIGSLVPTALMPHFAFAYERKGYMGELDKVSGSTHTAVRRDFRDNVPVDEFRQKRHRRPVYPGISLDEGDDPRNHGRLHINVGQRFPCPCGMASDYIVLQLFQILVRHPVLRHRAETGIYPVNHFIGRIFRKKGAAVLHPFAGGGRNGKLLVFEKQRFHLLQCQLSVQCYHIITSI